MLRRYSIVMLGALMAAATCAHAQKQAWWQRETAMAADGRLVLSNKPWWERAKTLREGERFTLDLNGDGHPDTVVSRVDGDIVEAIDDTGRAKDIWNKQDTTYVVSFEGSGQVDRMVSYIGNGRGGAREVELRYFRNGYLRYAWFARSEDGDAAEIFAIKRWQYAGNDRGSRFRGNSQIYINKYDPKRRSWQPLSECPFSFWDTDKDGRTDVTLRVSAAPTGTLHGPDTDYANNYDYMWAEEATPLERMGALNMRLSFNLDASPRTDALDKPHSTFSFTMVGSQPYRYAGMQDFDARRRAPQTTVHMPWSLRWTPAVRYPATAVGLTWDESRSVFRWEGEFWIYERRYLSNTGSPTHRWNMRREYSGKASAQRSLYFSAADSRYHLRGAQEGWLEAGQLVDEQKDLEFRWWDTDHDGYLDTVEVFRGSDARPSRVAHFRPAARPVVLDQRSLAAEYNKRVLPAAIAVAQETIVALKAVAADALSQRYEQAAAKADSQERRRYCLEMARELLFLRVLDEIRAAEAASPYATTDVDKARFRDPAAGSAQTGYTLGDSLRYWQLVRADHELNEQYSNGDFAAFKKTLQELHLN